MGSKNGSRLRLDGLGTFNFAPDGALDERLPFFRTAELDIILSENVVDVDSIPEQLSENRGAGVADRSSAIDTVLQFLISRLTIADVRGQGVHTLLSVLRAHKSRRCLTRLFPIAHSPQSGSYNTLGAEVVTSRSTSILGNVPGYVPGGRLGLARFAQTSMRRYESPNQIDVGAESSDRSSAVQCGGVAT